MAPKNIPAFQYRAGLPYNQSFDYESAPPPPTAEELQQYFDMEERGEDTSNLRISTDYPPGTEDRPDILEELGIRPVTGVENQRERAERMDCRPIERVATDDQPPLSRSERVAAAEARYESMRLSPPGRTRGKHTTTPAKVNKGPVDGQSGSSEPMVTASEGEWDSEDEHSGPQPGGLGNQPVQSDVDPIAEYRTQGFTAINRIPPPVGSSSESESDQEDPNSDEEEPVEVTSSEGRDKGKGRSTPPSRKRPGSPTGQERSKKKKDLRGTTTKSGWAVHMEPSLATVDREGLRKLFQESPSVRKLYTQFFSISTGLLQRRWWNVAFERDSNGNLITPEADINRVIKNWQGALMTYEDPTLYNRSGKIRKRGPKAREDQRQPGGRYAVSEKDQMSSVERAKVISNSLEQVPIGSDFDLTGHFLQDSPRKRLEEGSEPAFREWKIRLIANENRKKETLRKELRKSVADAEKRYDEEHERCTDLQKTVTELIKEKEELQNRTDETEQRLRDQIAGLEAQIEGHRKAVELDIERQGRRLVIPETELPMTAAEHRRWMRAIVKALQSWPAPVEFSDPESTAPNEKEPNTEQTAEAEPGTEPSVGVEEVQGGVAEEEAQEVLGSQPVSGQQIPSLVSELYDSSEED